MDPTFTIKHKHFSKHHYSSVTFDIRLVYGARMVLKLPESCVARREDVTFREMILRFLARRGVLRLF